MVQLRSFHNCEAKISSKHFLNFQKEKMSHTPTEGYDIALFINENDAKNYLCLMYVNGDD